MVDHAHVTGVIAQRIGHQVAQAQTAAERDQALKNALNSEQLARGLNQLGGDRLREKEEGMRNNKELMDEIHISTEAQELYRLYEAGFKEAPEKIHEKRQDQGNETPAPILETNQGE